MVALETPFVNIGWHAAPFRLQGTDGKYYTLDEVKGPNGLLVIYLCNHCPYVKAQLDRIIRDAKELKALGVNTVGIMSNDTEKHPDDSFENMQKLAREKHFPFPYLLDETQEVARAYGAVCTPDYFGFNAKLELEYRGRLDESWSLVIPNPRRELFEAMQQVAKTGKAPAGQAPSIGCSIEWKADGAKAAARA